MRTFLTILILCSAIWSLNAKSLRILKAETPPTIDGTVSTNDYWSDTWLPLDQTGVSSSTNFMSAKFQMKYDATNLYVVVKVNDTYKDTMSMNWWEKDNVQIYLAMDTDSYSSYGQYKLGDFQFAKIWSDPKLIGNIGVSWTPMNNWLLQNPTFYVAETSDLLSYTQEWKIPWSALVAEMPNAWSGQDFKFDIAATDRTTNGRTQMQFWNSGADMQWSNTRYFGYVTLDSAIQPVKPNCYANFDFYKIPLDSMINVMDSLEQQVSVEFKNTSTGDITSVLWDFGDGTSSTEENPTHTYKVTPWNPYVTACIKATNAEGEICQICKTITLFEPQTCSANFWYYQDWDGSGYSNTYYFYDMSQGNVVSWSWSFGDGTYSNEQNPTHTYSGFYGSAIVTLTITTASGCQSYTSNWIYIPAPSPDPICQVTVDKVTGKNLIKWSPSSGDDIKEYNVQKETAVRDVFKTIGTVSFDEAGSFLDQSSSPDKHADRYRLETIGKDGYSYGYSQTHQTIHLAVSQGNPLYYNLTWTPYYGFYFGTYYIYRGLKPDRLVLIDSISGNQTQYTDNHSGKAYYRVGVRNNYPCTSDSIIYFKSMALGSEIEDGITLSNMESLFAPDNIEETSVNFAAGPNPFDNQIKISSDVNSSKINIEIYNTLGEKIYSYNTNEVVNGHFEHLINAADLQGATKVCIVKFTAGNNTGISKLIKR